MKILLVSVRSKISRGGIAVWTERFLSKCEKHNIYCDLVNTELVGKRAERKATRRSLSDEFVRTKRIFKDLKTALNSTDYDAAHLNTSCGSFGLFRDYIVAKRIKRKKVRLIVHFHCDIPYWITNSISRKYLGKLLALADERLVLCENSREYLEKNYGVSSVKVPNFVDESNILEKPKSISDDIREVVFVGRVCSSKGSEEIYELAYKFSGVIFRLVGDVSDSESTRKKPENVVLEGGVDHTKVLEYMDNADIFLFPSHSEGFSLALAEAMARALPSIATDVGANSDMLEGGCGIVVKKGDIDAMARAIDELRSPKVRCQMSESSLRKAREKYATDSIISGFRNYYKNI